MRQVLIKKCFKQCDLAKMQVSQQEDYFEKDDFLLQNLIISLNFSFFPSTYD